MTQESTKTSRQRWDAFDHLRGMAAVAVVVLHGAYAYSFQPLVGLIWPVPLDEPNRIADGLFWATEGCVMPLFFLMSGFFLAQSLSRSLPGHVLRGRTRRLFVPMATIGIPILIVDLCVWGLGLVAMGQISLRDYLKVDYPAEIRADLFGPAHLWYLEYLWVMCAGVCATAWAWNRIGRASKDDHPPTVPVQERISFPSLKFCQKLKLGLCATGSANALGSRWIHPRTGRASGTQKFNIDEVLALGLIAGLIWLVLAIEPAIVVGFQHGWLPAFPKLFHGFMFLLMGMLLHPSSRLREGLRSFAPLLLAGALAAFCVMLPRVHAVLQAGDGTRFNAETGAILAAYALLATAGIVGGCLRWLDRPRPTLAALGAASFWLYIVHHPILGLAHLGLRPAPLPAGMKFLIATGGTLAICLVSYRYLVRDRLAGQLLNGMISRPVRPVADELIDVPGEPEQKRAA